MLLVYTRPNNSFYLGVGIYHLYNRGVAKQSIFKNDSDRRRILERYAKYTEQLNIETVAYSLMPNHIHFVLGSEEKEPDMASLMRKLGTSYVMYFNLKHDRVGHLFQNRYRTKPVLSDLYLLYLSKYVHQNPIKLIKQNVPASIKWEYLRKYRWSSYKAYCDIAKRSQSADSVYIDRNSISIKYSYINSIFGGGDEMRKYIEFVQTEIAKCEDILLSDMVKDCP